MRTFVFLLTLLWTISAVQAQAALNGSISVLTNRGDLVRNGSFNRWVRDFNKLHPGVSVKIELVERYSDEMSARFESRNYGDVILVPTDMPKAAYPGFFLPLNDMGLSDKVYFADSWRYEDKDYAYTQGVSAEGLIYNKNVLREAGVMAPPTTLQELYAICEKVKALGKTPFYLNVGAGWPLQQWDKAVLLFSGNGAYYSDMMKDNAPFAANKPYAQSLKIANEIFKRGFSEDDFVLDQWQLSKKDFAKDKTAFFFLGSWAVPQVIEEGIPSREVGFIPLPVDNSGSAKGILNFDWGLAINKYSKNPEAAKAWLDFVLTRSDFADTSGFIPTLKSRDSGMTQLAEYMSYKPEVIQTAAYEAKFLRIANKAGLDFLGGKYVRDILLSPDFEGSMRNWNMKWSQALASYQLK